MTIVLTYREGNETYTVDAAGNIGRPAIGMQPSGHWRFTGVRHKRQFITWLNLVQRLAQKESLPTSLFVNDIDHGTRREHGRAIDWIRLAPNADIELIYSLEGERIEREANERAVAMAARVAAGTTGDEIWRDSCYDIALIQHKDGWIVRNGDDATEILERVDAASALGFAIMHEAEDNA